MSAGREKAVPAGSSPLAVITSNTGSGALVRVISTRRMNLRKIGLYTLNLCCDSSHPVLPGALPVVHPKQVMKPLGFPPDLTCMGTTHPDRSIEHEPLGLAERFAGIWAWLLG